MIIAINNADLSFNTDLVLAIIVLIIMFWKKYYDIWVTFIDFSPKILRVLFIV